jgi:hypothetical protein
LPQPDFDDIRKSARNLAQQSGGEIKMEEWRHSGDECMKIVLTWKRPVVKPERVLADVCKDSSGNWSAVAY